MINKRLALAGLGRQVAGKGTPLANPIFSYGLTDGRVVETPVTQELEEITATQPVAPGANRLGIEPGVDLSTRAYPKTIGAFLYGALGGIATSGPVSGVYTHVITGTYDTPYWSVFGRHGADYIRVADAKFDELTLSWDEAGPLEVALKMAGITVLIGTAWTGTVNEVDSAGKFRARGGTFKVDSGGLAPPAVGFVKAGEISITRDLDSPRLSASILPGDHVPSMLLVTHKLTVVPDDLNEWRKVLAGTPAGTAISEAEVYGAFDHKFILDANTDLQIAVGRTSFTCDFPDADPGGGATELELEGEMVLPAAGEPITATLRNAQATY